MIVRELAVIDAVELAVFVKGEGTTAAEDLHIHTEHVGVGVHRKKACS